MHYEDLGGGTYKIILKEYRDCDVSTNPYQDSIEVNAYDNLQPYNLFSVVKLGLDSISDLQLISPISCDSTPTGACYRVLTYSRIVNLPLTINGYLLSYSRCCRVQGINNISNSVDAGVTVFSEIPGTNSGILINSSPKVGNQPEIILCLGYALDFDLSTLDLDGDSLIYELVAPYDAAGNQNSEPPYFPVGYNSGYSQLQPFGANSPVNLGLNSGILSMTPMNQGSYQLAVKVSEYRNGQYLGSTVRDFFFVVRPCASVNYFAEIRAQELLSGFQGYCSGLNINFINLSENLNDSYSWDFGVPGVNTDTSSLVNPTFTFPESGVYEVRLIINEGLQCTDTTYSQFIVYKKPDLNLIIDVDSVQCLQSNSFDFEVLGIPNDSSSFLWSFGLDASIISSSDLSVQNVEYSSIGVKPIKLYYSDNYCEDSLNASVEVIQPSQINLAFIKSDELSCAPFEITFENQSNASGAVTYLWDFGNGMISDNENTVYVNPGIYDVTLYAISDNGCVDTISETYPNFVEVFPSPIAGIDADRYLASPYDPIIEFYNQSLAYTSFEFHVENQISQEDPYAHSFVKSGIHYPSIIVENEYGCKDSASVRVELSAEETIFIPNGITPNGDGKNDVFELNLLDLLDLEFRIFNRNGSVVYETNDPNGTWDASFKGQIVPDGVYVYQLKYTDLNKIPAIKSGTLTILK